MIYSKKHTRLKIDALWGILDRNKPNCLISFAMLWENNGNHYQSFYLWFKDKDGKDKVVTFYENNCILKYKDNETVFDNLIMLNYLYSI
jgi:hypothetical protein